MNQTAMNDPQYWTLDELKNLRAVYRNGLLKDTTPFWMRHSIDADFGGYLTALDQDGSILEEDKSVWFQGRMAWMFSTLYLTVEKRAEWVDAARSGIEFLNRHCFDTDGRMFFSVTRKGLPLRKRRYLFSECFAIIALAAYGKASGQPMFVEQAERLFGKVLYYHRTPGLLPAKTSPTTRPCKGLSMPMILIVTAQELRKCSSLPLCSQVIDECMHEIQSDFMKPEFKAVMEMVGPGGELINNFEGRCINPGHSIEVAWFIMEEARLRKADPKLLQLGRTILDWSLELGWDKTHGGILYYRDARNLPSVEYWHDMKFWWPHNEALIATLLAYELTGETGYCQWHDRIHAWTYARFPDRKHGEWFGYLHRDGTVSTRIKGSIFKGFFHLPRMQWYCWQRLDAMIAEREGGNRG